MSKHSPENQEERGTGRKSPESKRARGETPTPPESETLLVNKTPKRRKFSEEDTAKVTTYFKRHIEMRQLPTIMECREFLELHSLERTPKNIQDKFRTIVRSYDTCLECNHHPILVTAQLYYPEYNHPILVLNAECNRPKYLY